MKQLYFCRHGQSQSNLEETYAGQLDTPLTESGREQARAAGEAAKALGIQKIVASPLSRALETAQIIAAAIDYPLDTILVNEIFMERSYGSLQGMPWNTPNPEQYTIEPITSLQERVKIGLEFLKSLEDDTVLLVGHGTFGRHLRSLIDDMPPTSEMANATILRFI